MPDTPHSPDTDPLTPSRAWLAAALDPQISGELELVYQHIARDVEERQPVCDQSGRCCNFEKWGHRLYVTGLEAAYLYTRLDNPLTPGDITRARQAGGCPFQKALLCSVHEIRPIGCRAYYCDQSAQGWQEALTERMLAEVRAIHDRHQIPYQYAEWRAMLASLLT